MDAHDQTTGLEKVEALHCETVAVPGIQAEEVVYTEEDAQRVKRKLDLWIMPILMVSYALQYWDKTLLGQSVLFNLSSDLHLVETVGYDSAGKAITNSQKFANASLIFYIGYIVATYPMALLTQRFPTAKVCAASIFVWAIVVMTTPACQTYAELMVNRFFLGVAESCLGPTFTVYVTFWWTRREQALRSGLWYGVVSMAMMITPLLSYGLGHIQGPLGSPWRYMYLVAGLISMLWSGVVLWVLPDDPVRAKWLNPRDRAIVMARIKENNAGLVDRRFKSAQVWEALKDFNLWSNAFFVGATGIPNGAISTFSTLVISGFGFDSFTSLLLIIPLGGVTFVSVLSSSVFLRKFDGWRFYMMILCTIPALAGSLMCWLGPKDNKSLLYAGVVLLPFQIAANAIGVGMASSNVSGHTKKATVSGATFVGYCIGNIVGPLCFTSTPGPQYTGGFISCVVVMLAVIVLAAYGRWHLGKENARRDREYGPPGTGHALEDLTDRENKDFRYML